jgi:PST family polysaccharide transporter
MKIVLQNLISIGLVQGINLIIPLILAPFLINTLGVELYGIISTAQAIALLCTIITEFGFNITAVRGIASARGDYKIIHQTVNNVFFLKIFLLAITSIIFLTVIVVVPKYHAYFFIYTASYLLVIGQAFSPVWFFQGIENIKQTIPATIIFKFIALAFILLLVKGKADAPYVNLILGLANLCSGLLLYWQIYRQYKISLKNITLQSLKKEYRQSLAIFLSNVGVVIYSNSNFLILSFFLSPAALGIYSVIDKIIQVLRTLLIFIHQVTYPRLCNLVQEGDAIARHFLKKIYALVYTGVLLVSMLLFFFPEMIAGYFIKDRTSLIEAAKLLRYVSFLPFIVSLNMPFFQSLLAYKKDWLTVKLFFICAIFSIILNFSITPFLKATGGIITMYVCESLVTFSIIILYYKLIYLGFKNNKSGLI